MGAARQVTTGAALLGAGWAVGGALGLLNPLLGAGLGATVLLLVGGGWGGHRAGGAGVLAAFIGAVAAVGLAFEAHRTWLVRTAEVTPVDVLDEWHPAADDGRAFLVPPLAPVVALAGAVTRETSSGKSRRRVHQRAVPLVEAATGRVVAFTCDTSLPVRAGTYALSATAWHGGPLELCDDAIVDAVKKCAAAGRALAPGAPLRNVVLFPDEATLRHAHHLPFAFGFPAACFGVFAVVVLVRAGQRRAAALARRR